MFIGFNTVVYFKILIAMIIRKPVNLSALHVTAIVYFRRKEH